MLVLTQLAGFGAGGGGTDVTPQPIEFSDVADSGFVAVAFTNAATIAGIDAAITLRLTLSAAMTASRTVGVYRDGQLVVSGNAGNTIDVVLTNGQTLQYAFTNAQDATTWAGTATLSNPSDGGATLDAFAFTLSDTGSAPVGGGGGPQP